MTKTKAEKKAYYEQRIKECREKERKYKKKAHDFKSAASTERQWIRRYQCYLEELKDA